MLVIQGWHINHQQMQIRNYKLLKTFTQLISLTNNSLIITLMLATVSCSTINQFINKKDKIAEPELNVKASPSQNPQDQLKIFGNIEIEAYSSNALPYRAVNYHVQLLNQLQTEVLSESQTNSNGEFFFTVEKEKPYFLKIISNQNKILTKIHGPFTAGDALTIKISSPEFK